jgi:hypothetical protein
MGGEHHTFMTSEHQPFDSTLKALVQTSANTLLPPFLPGVTYIETLNVELLRPTMRADRVFKVLYRGENHILHLEFESSSDPYMAYMAARLLTYNAIIYQEYLLPVISIIIYPFRVKMAEPPLQITSRHEKLVTFYFKVLPLWQLNAEQYVQEHDVSIYALLPTMQGVTDELLLQAMQDMIKYYQDDDVMLARQFVWMGIMLRRADTIPPENKQKMQERLRMFERLWDEDPEIQRIKSEAEAKGRSEAIKISQEMVVLVVGTRFPGLTEIAHEQVEKISRLESLRQLAKQIATAPDEATARWALGTYAA